MGISKTQLLPAMQSANTSRRPTDQYNISIGLGWHLTKTLNGIIHWHNGETGGYHSYLAWDPGRKIGVVVLANAMISNEDVGLHLLDPANAIIPHQPRHLPTPIPVSPQVLAQYAGKYQLTDTMGLVIRVDGASIFMQPTNQSEVELFARSDNQFYQRGANIEITFYKNASGEVDRLVYVEGGTKIEAKKAQ